MGLKGFGGSQSSHPSAKIPRLYPHLKPHELERFLTDDLYQRIKSFNIFYINPFFSRTSSPRQQHFGQGLSWVMIRNLMLLQNVSIRGPEDTPHWACEDALNAKKVYPRTYFVVGVADLGNEGYSLKVGVHRPGVSPSFTRVRHQDFRTFLLQCSAAIAKLIGGQVTEEIRAAWQVGQPRDAQSLIELGRIAFTFREGQSAEREAPSIRLLNADPNSALATWGLDDGDVTIRHIFLNGLSRDPFNAQICFYLICNIWNGKPHPEALQFGRKAIELSPGHGKSHMCTPHGAEHPAELMRHSELGYLLLRGNTFAISTYIIALIRAKRPAEIIIPLCEEGIEEDPCDPRNYRLLIETFYDRGDYRSALLVAEALHQLFVPVLNERTLYCMQQNPVTRKQLETGELDPAEENVRRMDYLRSRLHESNPMIR